MVMNLWPRFLAHSVTYVRVGVNMRVTSFPFVSIVFVKTVLLVTLKMHDLKMTDKLSGTRVSVLSVLTLWPLCQINTKNCSLSIVLTATDQKPQKSLKR